MSTIYDAAIKFQELMQFEYKIALGYKGKSVEVPIRFDENDFHHLCGLHKLTDLQNISSVKNKSRLFKEILDNKITDSILKQSAYYLSDEVYDRINRVCELPSLLNRLSDKTTFLYKFNQNANIGSNIPGNYLIKGQSDDKKNIYFILLKDSAAPDKYFGISIFSRELSDKKQKDFAAGHTPNTLLYVSKTPLTENRQLDKSKEVVLYQRPSYSAPNNSNIKIVKFTPITSVVGDTAVLAVPHFSFGQAIVNLINKWADKIQEGIDNRRRELQSAKEEISELKRALSKRDEQLAQKDEQLSAKDDEIAVLYKQNTDLTKELYEQKKLIRAAHPHKTLSQKIEEAKKKSREQNAANSRSNPPNQTHHKL